MRAFVIGNGPSLNKTPVDALRNEFTIGINRFDLLGLEWSPDWWILVDVAPEHDWWNFEELLKRDSMFVFREHDRYFIEPLGRDNVTFIKPCHHPDPEKDWEWHLPEPCGRGGGASIALQLAASLGKSPVYLVGCDLYKYRGPDDVDINHFDPNYCSYKVRKSTGEEIVGLAEWESLNNRLVRAHAMARDSAADMGITVYNATVGGKLEVYPRVDIRAVLNGKE